MTTRRRGLKAITLGILITYFGMVAHAYADTLEDTVHTAITFHPKINAQKASRDAAHETITEERSNYFPTLSLSASAGRIHADDDTTRSLTGGADQSYLGTGSISLQQMLFDGFEIKNRVKAAESREEAAESEVDVSSEKIALQAIQAHLNVMRTRELFEHAANYIQKLQEYVFSIKLLVQEGAADESEFLQAQELVIAAQNTLINFENEAEKAEAVYLEIVGQLPADILVTTQEWKSYLPDSLSEAIELGTQSHPRLESARKTSNAIDKDKSAERARIIPKFNAELSYSERDQDDTLSGESTNAQALVRMSWDFSTGGAYTARVRRTSFLHIESLAREDELRRNIEKDIRNAHAEFLSTAKREQLMNERTIAAQKTLETYNTQFEGGQRTLLQIIAAENRLFDAKVAMLGAGYRHILSNFEYLAAMGQLREALNITNGGDSYEHG